jgi:hypothetical protein
VYDTSSTPTVASAKVSGTARPTLPITPCGLMLAAIDGAIRATEMPTASQMFSSRRNTDVPPAMPSPRVRSKTHGERRP